jgi:hypothetical protein
MYLWIERATSLGKHVKLTGLAEAEARMSGIPAKSPDPKVYPMLLLFRQLSCNIFSFNCSQDRGQWIPSMHSRGTCREG